MGPKVIKEFCASMVVISDLLMFIDCQCADRFGRRKTNEGSDLNEEGKRKN